MNIVLCRIPTKVDEPSCAWFGLTVLLCLRTVVAGIKGANARMQPVAGKS